jgi:hypothetical protein
MASSGVPFDPTAPTGEAHVPMDLAGIGHLGRSRAVGRPTPTRARTSGKEHCQPITQSCSLRQSVARRSSCRSLDRCIRPNGLPTN